ERKLDLDEKPLVVQLNWNKDDREGRFVLKNENDIIPKVSDGEIQIDRQAFVQTPLFLW
ncbi:afadin isoform X1, partial [Tachysurus ichikawai]